MDDKLQPLPVEGYTAQEETAVAAVNANKRIEERVLRRIDRLADPQFGYNQRDLAIARTKVEEAFMWMNRAVFKPQRIKLPEDDGNGIG